MLAWVLFLAGLSGCASNPSSSRHAQIRDPGAEPRARLLHIAWGTEIVAPLSHFPGLSESDLLACRLDDGRPATVTIHELIFTPGSPEPLAQTWRAGWLPALGFIGILEPGGSPPHPDSGTGA